MDRARIREDHFERLYRDCYGRVLAYVLRRSSPDTAHDVVADTFLVAWRRLDSAPPEPVPWLLGIARKTLANQRRGARRRLALVNVLAVREGPDMRQRSSEPATDAAVAALDRLPEHDRELLKLIAWDGLDIAEAAQVLGISPSTCRVRLHRARRRLAGELEASQAGRRRPSRSLSTAKEPTP